MDRLRGRMVWLAEGAYLCTPDSRYDVHNDYDVQTLEVDWSTATLNLTLVRATGTWVDKQLPTLLRLSLCLVRDLVLTDRTEDDLHRKDINLIAYTSWAAPLADRDVWFDESPEADTLAIEFGDGSYLRARADVWTLEVGQP